MSAVRFAFDLEDDGAIDDAVEEGHGQGRIAEVVGPGVEVDVGDQGGGPLRAAGVDDLEEEVGGLRRLLAFDVIEAEFVDDQQVEAGVVADALRQGLVGQRGGQVVQQAGAGGVADGVAEDTRGLGRSLESGTIFPRRLCPTKTRLSRRRMNAAVASSSIWPRSMAARLNSQSKALRGLRSRKRASRMRRAMLRSRRWSACSAMSRCRNS